MAVMRSNITLAAMAPSPSAMYDPVRMQKLLFLIDAEIAGWIDGPHFNFRPHNYGPLDIDVYVTLKELAATGHVRIDRNRPHRRYKLTEEGCAQGQDNLADFPPTASSYIRRANQWVLATSVEDLLSAIFQRYPEMAVNTIVPQLVPGSHPRRQSGIAAIQTGLARSIDCVGILDERPDYASDVADDAEALRSDWQRVGGDIRSALTKHDSTRGRACGA